MDWVSHFAPKHQVGFGPPPTGWQALGYKATFDEVDQYARAHAYFVQQLVPLARKCKVVDQTKLQQYVDAWTKAFNAEADILGSWTPVTPSTWNAAYDALQAAWQPFESVDLQVRQAGCDAPDYNATPQPGPGLSDIIYAGVSAVDDGIQEAFAPPSPNNPSTVDMLKWWLIGAAAFVVLANRR